MHTDLFTQAPILGTEIYLKFDAVSIAPYSLGCDTYCCRLFYLGKWFFLFIYYYFFFFIEYAFFL